MKFWIWDITHVWKPRMADSDDLISLHLFGCDVWKQRIVDSDDLTSLHSFIYHVWNLMIVDSDDKISLHLCVSPSPNPINLVPSPPQCPNHSQIKENFISKNEILDLGYHPCLKTKDGGFRWFDIITFIWLRRLKTTDIGFRWFYIFTLHLFTMSEILWWWIQMIRYPYIYVYPLPPTPSISYPHPHNAPTTRR